jgi:hypothetical protein
MRAYFEKFGYRPEGRPYFALLGSFDKTLTMFREGRKIEIEVSGFSERELTFMYPDHAHLVTIYDSDAPPLFYQPPPDWDRESFWGRLFTFAELQEEYSALGIDRMIRVHKEREGWAGCYVEAHVWRRGLREEAR